jgi:hypothetical protein
MTRILTLLLLTTMIGCKEISFREPQPLGRKILRAVPKELQGKYLTYDDDGQLSKDTIVITATGYYFGYFSPEDRVKAGSEYDRGSLNDSLVLKKYQGYYFVNVNEDPEWLLRVLKPAKNGDLIYMTPEQQDVDFKDYVRKISKEVRVDSFDLNKEKLYQIDPTPRQLVNLIEKGFFTQTVLKKIR